MSKVEPMSSTSDDPIYKLDPYTTHSTCHALFYYRHNHIKGFKIFWLVVFFACTAGLCWSSVEVLKYYSGAKTQVHVKVVRPEGLKLPPLTVCSMRRVNQTLANQIGLDSVQSIDYLYGTFASLSGFGFSTEEVIYFRERVNVTRVRREYYNGFRQWANTMKGESDEPDMGNMLKDISQKCVPGETFRCQIGGREIPNCCSRITHFPNYNGPCFKFDFLADFEQDVGGIRDGMVILFQPPDKKHDPKSLFNVHTTKGLQLFRDEFDAGIESSPFFLAEGWQYSLALEVRQTILQKDRNNCSDTAYKHYQQTVTAPDDPQSHCMYLCLTTRFAKTCGCKPINSVFIRTLTVPYCDPERVSSAIFSPNISFIRFMSIFWGTRWNL